MDVELMLDCRATIGESPTWFARDGALFWIDVKEPALHRWSADGARRSWRLEADIGAFALLEKAAAAVVALRTGIFRLDLKTGETALLAPPPFDPERFRFNEGLCDRLGRFWIGVMFDPVSGDAVAPRPKAALHRFTLGEGLLPALDQSDLHNGFAWSPAEDAFFWSHSYEGQIFRTSYDLVAGAIGPPNRFADVRRPGHVPDGAAMDEEGCYWCAIHGGSALHRYDPVGRMLLQVALPVSQPTMCAFVGPHLDEIMITSAREKLTPEQLRQEPHAGGLFRLRPGVRGVSRPCVVR